MCRGYVTEERPRIPRVIIKGVNYNAEFSFLTLQPQNAHNANVVFTDAVRAPARLAGRGGATRTLVRALETSAVNARYHCGVSCILVLS